MKKFIVVEILNGGRCIYDKKSKSYKQKTILKGTYDTFEKAMQKWRKLRKEHKFFNYKIQYVER